MSSKIAEPGSGHLPQGVQVCLPVAPCGVSSGFLTALVNIDAMRHALERAKAGGKGQPGLGAQHFAKLEKFVSRLEKDVSP